jgi:nicotinate-nucleotide adenylyltransferase
MASKAAAESRHPWLIQASAVETTLPRPSYTINTLRFLEARFPGTRFSILVGGDNAGEMTSWREADKILGHYPIYVYPRGGQGGGGGSGDDASFPDGVTVLEGAPLLDISSTGVREMLKAGREHYRAGDFGAAANDFSHALELSPWSIEAAGYLEMIDEIQNFRNTDLLNP